MFHVKQERVWIPSRSSPERPRLAQRPMFHVKRRRRRPCRHRRDQAMFHVKPRAGMGSGLWSWSRLAEHRRLWITRWTTRLGARRGTRSTPRPTAAPPPRCRRRRPWGAPHRTAAIPAARAAGGSISCVPGTRARGRRASTREPWSGQQKEERSQRASLTALRRRRSPIVRGRCG